MDSDATTDRPPDGRLVLLLFLAIAVWFGTRFTWSFQQMNGCSLTSEKQVQTDLANFEFPFRMFKLNMRRMPTESEGLQALCTRPSGLSVYSPWRQTMTVINPYPWGRPFLYSYESVGGKRHAIIRSQGRDTNDSTDDFVLDLGG